MFWLPLDRANMNIKHGYQFCQRSLWMKPSALAEIALAQKQLDLESEKIGLDLRL